MIGINVLIAEIEGLRSYDLERWIDNDWVRPSRQAGAYVFCDIDVERIRLIQEMSYRMQIDEDALPVVLMLLDQLYDLRRRMHALGKDRTNHDRRDTASAGSAPEVKNP